MAMDAMRASSIMSDYIDVLFSDESYNGGDEIINKLAEVLDSEFQQAEPSLPNIDITTANNTLSLTGMSQEQGKNNAYILAYRVMEYWSRTTETTGTPVPFDEEENENCDTSAGSECESDNDEECYEIIEVTNDAMSYVTPLRDAILDLVDGNLHLPRFYDLFATIFEYVRKIKWTVTEKSLKYKSNNGEDCLYVFTVQVK